MINNTYKTSMTDGELLDTFPEAKEVIPEKIRDWERKKDGLLEAVKKKLKIIKEKSLPENQWFWREWVKVNDVAELVKINYHITRLRGQLANANGGKNVKGKITEEQIQRALAMPIENIFSQKFRKMGQTLRGLCPFHPEKTPSFYIYPKTNTCWCFGCQQGGNTIKSVRLLYGYSFREAVHYLIGK